VTPADGGSASFPVVTLKGDARARGHAFGDACRPLIRKSLEYYLDAVFRPRGCTDALLRDYALQSADVIGRFSPQSLEEIEAVAEAADLPSWQVLVLNSRTEILNVAGRLAAPECTAFYMADGRILAQNWDWIRIGLACAVMLQIETDDGRRMSVFTEAGMLGKIGINSNGVGVCLNILQAPHERIGVPVSVVSRVVLDAASAGEARRVFQAAGSGRATHFLVGDAHGDCVSIEYAGDEVYEVSASDGVLVHTNHLIASRARVELTEAVAGSVARLERAAELCALPGPGTVGRAKSILADQTNEYSPINVAWRASSFVKGEDISTCAAIVMEIAAGAMHIRRGFELDAPWAVYRP